MSLGALEAAAGAVRREIARTVQGQDEAVDLLLIALFSRGHCLLEGPPGTAKTLLARSLAAALKLDYGRIQFTPDLMPGDVLGVNLFDFRSGSFRLTKGPVFTEVLLADEINRAPPKTQSALLQVMSERNATIDGVDYPLGESFFVIGTQNPIESQGTYPLPEAQLDRFLFKIEIDFPAEAVEMAILRRHADQPLDPAQRLGEISAVVDARMVAEGRAAVDAVRLDDSILAYILRLVRATRTDPDIRHGASTRAADALAAAVRAAAALDGRDYALPDDVQRLILPTLRHRIVPGPTAEIEGRSADVLLAAILAQIDAPR